MRGDIAIIRKALSTLPDVSRIWFEWTWEDAMWVKTLVVEVAFDTDPDSMNFRPAILDAIERSAITGMADDTTMVISHLKIVPKAK